MQIISSFFALLVALQCSTLVLCSPAPRPQGNNVTEEITQKELQAAIAEFEKAEKLQEANNTTREARGVLMRMAFLTGMKVGELVQASGSLSASNSLTFFGKQVNSAFSFSYGAAGNVQDLSHGQESEGISNASADLSSSSIETKSRTKAEYENKRKHVTNLLKQHDLPNRAYANSKYLRTPGNKDAH